MTGGLNYFIVMCFAVKKASSSELSLQITLFFFSCLLQCFCIK